MVSIVVHAITVFANMPRKTVYSLGIASVVFTAKENQGDLTNVPTSFAYYSCYLLQFSLDPDVDVRRWNGG
jgi:hypothetical protein